MEKTKIVTLMVESPKGFNQKFEYEPEERRLRLSKILPAGLVFPFDFGMSPGTKDEDCDPLNVIVVCEAATFPGCMIECRVIGTFQAQHTERDVKTMRKIALQGCRLCLSFIRDVVELAYLPESILNQMENYNEQADKQFHVTASCLQAMPLNFKIKYNGTFIKDLR